MVAVGLAMVADQIKAIFQSDMFCGIGPKTESNKQQRCCEGPKSIVCREHLEYFASSVPETRWQSCPKCRMKVTLPRSHDKGFLQVLPQRRHHRSQERCAIRAAFLLPATPARHWP